MPDPSAAGGPSGRFSWFTKVLAPLALTLVVIAVVLVVDSSRSGDEADGARSGAVAGKSDRSGGSSEGDDEEPETYVVEAGDSLSTIADENGLTVQQLLRLNRGSGIDPQALAEGQELKLSR